MLKWVKLTSLEEGHWKFRQEEEGGGGGGGEIQRVKFFKERYKAKCKFSRKVQFIVQIQREDIRQNVVSLGSAGIFFCL